MKPLLAFCFFLSIFMAHSQTWCDAGANWKYSYSNGFGTEGYTNISFLGDTLINGQLSQILGKHIYAYNFLNAQSVDFDAGKEYTYESNGIVYLWYNNNWDTLYNFNANVGESWRMAKQPFTNACDSNSMLTVIAIGTKNINSQTLNYLVVDFSFPNGYSDTIVEKIGFINSYLLPYDICNGALDANEGGSFRCYQDNFFPTYKPHFAESCDFIASLNDLNSINHFSLFPNPASETITIKIPDENNCYNSCSLLDASGREIKPIKLTDSETQIDISDINPGIYFVKVGDWLEKVIVQ